MRAYSFLCAAFLVVAFPAAAQPQPPSVSALIDQAVLDEIETWVDTEIVRLSILTQNERYGLLDQAEINALDEQWKVERKAVQKPLIAATLSNPLSVYLTRMQGRSVGLFVEIFVMDHQGLNVGQSSITGDFWQGDEAKFQRTYPEGPQAFFIDEPEWDDTLHIWRVQINRTIAAEDGITPIGAVTVEVNMTELERRHAAAARS